MQLRCSAEFASDSFPLYIKPNVNTNFTMTSILNKTFTLGILGGGQLGRMLIQSAMNFDVRLHVIDSDMNAPCKPFCHEFTAGSLTDFQTVYRFGKRVDMLTVEIENVNVEALEKLESEGVVVYPQPHIIRTIQDKGSQKQFFRDHNIPTSDFILIDNKDQLRQHTSRFPAMQKLRRMGYDGRGVYKISSWNDLPNAFEKPSILEPIVKFDKEISVIVARNEHGEMRSYPAVEMIFHPGANLVEYLLAPARIPKSIETTAEETAVRVANTLGIVGLAAVEMFVTDNGEVLVNEVAPRVHNSGHHTIEANETSQFEQHLRAIFGLPLGSTATVSPAVMVNLLGTVGYNGAARYDGLKEVLAIEGAHIHLYGKDQTKPFRKMGHVTIVDQNIDSALEKAQQVKLQLKVVA